MTIINSLLDTDFYKFSMLQAIIHQFPHCIAEYEFVCRNEDVRFPPEFLKELNKELDHLCSLRFTEDELSYLSKIRFFKPDFIEYLRMFQLDRNKIIATVNDGRLYIRAKGAFQSATMFEVYVLSIVNELYFRLKDKEDPFVLEEGRITLENNLNMYTSPYNHGIKFADFGTRRRYSFAWHDEVIQYLLKHGHGILGGTSNVFFAKKYGIIPVGTMAHEIFMASQQLTRLKESQQFTLQKWADEYRGDLGVALTDTIGVDAFLRDFDLYFAKLFDGVRHDSGDPKEFANKIIEHYKKLGIDPKTKSITFSDGLTFKKMLDLRVFNGEIKVLFGIGTKLTNDMGEGHKPLNIVMKMVTCNGQPVAKISDGAGKTMCHDPLFIDYLKQQFGVK